MLDIEERQKARQIEEQKKFAPFLTFKPEGVFYPCDFKVLQVTKGVWSVVETFQDDLAVPVYAGMKIRFVRRDESKDRLVLSAESRMGRRTQVRLLHEDSDDSWKEST